jgi:glutamate synthase domain-containing protein 2
MQCGLMMALGCIQAQTCHTGVTTQDTLRQCALLLADKAERVRQPTEC